MNPPTQIFQSLKTPVTFLQDKASKAESPVSFLNFSTTNSRSFSSRNPASSGKSIMTQYPAIESAQVTIPSKMKTPLARQERGSTPSPSTIPTNTIHFPDCGSKKTTESPSESRRREEK
jgi:hypothetical protein